MPIKKKQLNKGWEGKAENPKIVVKRDRFEPKYMFSIFFKLDVCGLFRKRKDS
jgi:hypothetical protein